jgi:hypothetical protein
MLKLRLLRNHVSFLKELMELHQEKTFKMFLIPEHVIFLIFSNEASIGRTCEIWARLCGRKKCAKGAF